MPKHIVELNENSHVAISMGNIKIGKIANFSTLPSNELFLGKDGEILTDIVGTCGKYCECCKHACYAINSLKRFHNTVVPSWGKNTLMLRNKPECVKQEIIEFVNKKHPDAFRFHTSGEWENVDHIKLYCEICEACPDTKFYTYTKAFDLLAEFFRNGNNIPSNFVINLSEWHGNIDKFLDENNIEDDIREKFTLFNIFSYDDHTDECMSAHTKMVHCPAVDVHGHETGVTCIKCKRCITQNHKTAVYDH